MKKKYYLLLGLVVISWLGKVAPVEANCPDTFASWEVVKPAIARIAKTTKFVAKIEDNKIILTDKFDSLNGRKKQEILKLFDNWFNNLTPQEQQTALQNPGLGAMSPYGIYGNDGRALSLPYDGCSRNLLLTERQRFSWYFNRNPSPDNSHNLVTAEDLRNGGQPFWREVRFSISRNEEKRVRLRFWRAIGYDKNKSWWEDSGWWIAWVPERGHFEINLPSNYNRKILNRFWQIAPRQYKYVIVTNDGTWLGEKAL